MVRARGWQQATAHARALAQTPPPAWALCGMVHPVTRQDVTPLHCRLPRTHRSLEHWHPALWAGQPGVVWRTDA